MKLERRVPESFQHQARPAPSVPRSLRAPSTEPTLGHQITRPRLRRWRPVGVRGPAEEQVPARAPSRGQSSRGPTRLPGLQRTVELRKRLGSEEEDEEAQAPANSPSTLSVGPRGREGRERPCGFRCLDSSVLTAASGSRKRRRAPVPGTGRAVTGSAGNRCPGEVGTRSLGLDPPLLRTARATRGDPLGLSDPPPSTAKPPGAGHVLFWGFGRTVLKWEARFVSRPPPSMSQARTEDRGPWHRRAF